MKYEVIDWICKSFVMIYDYFQALLRVGRAEFVFSLAGHEISVDHSSTFTEYSKTSAECMKAQCVPRITVIAAVSSWSQN